jgi:hypothetical protein
MARGVRNRDEGRPDPTGRHIDGTAVWVQLKNKRAGWHYVLVSKHDPNVMSHYVMAGYRPVEMAEGGPQPAGICTSRPGEAVEVAGCVLMECSPERYQQIVAEGAFGQSGQSHADEVMMRIREAGGADIRGFKAPEGTRLTRSNAEAEM